MSSYKDRKGAQRPRVLYDINHDFQGFNLNS